MRWPFYVRCVGVVSRSHLLQHFFSGFTFLSLIISRTRLMCAPSLVGRKMPLKFNYAIKRSKSQAAQRRTLNLSGDRSVAYRERNMTCHRMCSSFVSCVGFVRARITARVLRPHMEITYETILQLKWRFSREPHGRESQRNGMHDRL